MQYLPEKLNAVTVRSNAWRTNVGGVAAMRNGRQACLGTPASHCPAGRLLADAAHEFASGFKL